MPALTSAKNFFTNAFTKVKDRIAAWRDPKANAT